MKLKHEELQYAIEHFPNFVTAIIIEGCFIGTAPDVYLENWIWNSDVNYAVLEVLKSETPFNAPFVKVIGYRTVWGSN